MLTYTMTVVVARHWKDRKYSKQVYNRITKVYKAERNTWHLCNLYRRGKALYLEWGHNPWRFHLKGAPKRERVNW